MLEKCWYCGLDIPQDEAIPYKIKMGISKKYFPSFEYKEVMLCSGCLASYQKKEKNNRYFAIFLLIFILAIMASGLYLAFTS